MLIVVKYHLTYFINRRFNCFSSIKTKIKMKQTLNRQNYYLLIIILSFSLIVNHKGKAQLLIRFTIPYTLLNVRNRGGPKHIVVGVEKGVK